ncbi:class IIb bacteriocin, lactobin A/cerein 7B family [Carboxylicivirga caseinilyticus]|uniref:class IIb bacteriocin, lactobin A/cerein 7B family n=1 Tax=Carboxylicivirga caseinilyticus TaxID=3417572 RepID=UPI003D356849|nr:class IIb bacteriocin, lactobin A/cerein 7B family [Marinilabiliaceae bacterium A049]
MIEELSDKELKTVNGGIAPVVAVLTAFGVIGAIDRTAYYIGYVHGWIDKQIDELTND